MKQRTTVDETTARAYEGEAPAVALDEQERQARRILLARADGQRERAGQAYARAYKRMRAAVNAMEKARRVIASAEKRMARLQVALAGA